MNVNYSVFDDKEKIFKIVIIGYSLYVSLLDLIIYNMCLC